MVVARRPPKPRAARRPCPRHQGSFCVHCAEPGKAPEQAPSGAPRALDLEFVSSQDEGKGGMFRAPWHDRAYDEGAEPVEVDTRLPLAYGSSRPVSHDRADEEFALVGFYDHEEDQLQIQRYGPRRTTSRTGTAEHGKQREALRAWLEGGSAECEAARAARPKAWLYAYEFALGHGYGAIAARQDPPVSTSAVRNCVTGIKRVMVGKERA